MDERSVSLLKMMPRLMIIKRFLNNLSFHAMCFHQEMIYIHLSERGTTIQGHFVDGITATRVHL